MPEEKKATGSKSSVVKKLKATAAAGAYQKQWFFDMKARVEREGCDFAILNADVPMEIFRAMDIPFVVNQWWAAICGAKRMTRKYAQLMTDNGYRNDLNSYDAQALAESFDPDDHKLDEEGKPLGPWGGLPKPTISITRLTGDCQSKIFGLIAQNYGADLYVMENTVARKTPLNWYELTADRWEELYDKDRIDLAVEELKALISYLEMKTGKMMDMNKLQHVMDLINEQEGYYKKIRDMIAASHPVPVTVVDTINAVMQAQWQRGTEWAAAHAKSLYEEIKELIDFYEEVPEYDTQMYCHKKMKTTEETSLAVLKEVLPVLEAQEEYTNDPLYASLSAFVKEHGYKNGYVMWPLRTAVSGKQMTPAGATEIMEIIGKEETLKRVHAAIEKLENK